MKGRGVLALLLLLFLLRFSFPFTFISSNGFTISVNPSALKSAIGSILSSALPKRLVFVGSGIAVGFLAYDLISNSNYSCSVLDICTSWSLSSQTPDGRYICNHSFDKVEACHFDLYGYIVYRSSTIIDSYTVTASIAVASDCESGCAPRSLQEALFSLFSPVPVVDTSTLPDDFALQVVNDLAVQSADVLDYTDVTDGDGRVSRNGQLIDIIVIPADITTPDGSTFPADPNVGSGTGTDTGSGTGTGTDTGTGTGTDSGTGSGSGTSTGSATQTVQIEVPQADIDVVSGVPDNVYDPTIDIPQKLDIPSLIQSFINNSPLLRWVQGANIQASPGACSVSGSWSLFGQSFPITLDFCPLQNTLNLLGSFILAFAHLYALYIIFRID